MDSCDELRRSDKQLRRHHSTFGGTYHDLPRIPRYILSPEGRLQSDAIEFLVRKGVFTVPDIHLRNELLKSYIQNVHPSMPFLNLGLFLQHIILDENTPAVSLLLFHAVMFAAAVFIDPCRLCEGGYITSAYALRLFYDKVKLLYNFDYESDRLILMQSLLLMTYVSEISDVQRDAYHWLGLAMSFAQRIGLHDERCFSPEEGFRRRLWWSLCIRDSYITLHMRRPSFIKPQDYQITMITMSDFDFYAISHEAKNALGIPGPLHSIEQQMQDASLFIEQATLCFRISHMLHIPDVCSAWQHYCEEQGLWSSPYVVNARAKYGHGDICQETTLFFHRCLFKLFHLANRSSTDIAF